MSHSIETVIQHVRAPNDTNGNPRRLFLVHHLPSNSIHAFDEGYSGIAAVPEAFMPNARESWFIGSINVGAAEYKRLLKAHG